MINLVTVKNKVPLFKGEEPATSIELLEFEEMDFKVVRQKDLSFVGEKLIFIHPDYCVPDNGIFEEYIRPGGDPKKSKLGGNNRIKAIKFNLHTGDNVKVFSQGIVLSQEDLRIPLERVTSEKLGITKYVEPEISNEAAYLRGGTRPFPSFLYKTDEPRIETVPSSEFRFEEDGDTEYVGRLKVDGSSITIFCSGDKGVGICSRNNQVMPTVHKVIARKVPTIWQRFLMFFGVKIDLLIKAWVPNDSEFIQVGIPYLERLQEFWSATGKNIALRGELCGQGLRGSGNKNNPHANLQKQIIFFGADYITDNGCIRMSDRDFEAICTQLDFKTAPVLFYKAFFNKEDIVKQCNKVFETALIEGIVVRDTMNTVSVKVINAEYDAKK
jgi:hypothetical protein